MCIFLEVDWVWGLVWCELYPSQLRLIQIFFTSSARYKCQVYLQLFRPDFNSEKEVNEYLEQANITLLEDIFSEYSNQLKILTILFCYMLDCRIILCPSSPWTLWTSVTGRAEFSAGLNFLFFVAAAWIWMESALSCSRVLEPSGRGVRPELNEDVSWKMTSSTSSSLRCWWFTWWLRSLSSLFLPRRRLGCGGGLGAWKTLALLFLSLNTLLLLLLRPFFFLFLNLILPLTTNFPTKKVGASTILFLNDGHLINALSGRSQRNNNYDGWFFNLII